MDILLSQIKQPNNKSPIFSGLVSVTWIWQPNNLVIVSFSGCTGVRLKNNIGSNKTWVIFCCFHRIKCLSSMHILFTWNSSRCCLHEPGIIVHEIFLDTTLIEMMIPFYHLLPVCLSVHHEAGKFFSDCFTVLGTTGMVGFIIRKSLCFPTRNLLRGQTCQWSSLLGCKVWHKQQNVLTANTSASLAFCSCTLTLDSLRAKRIIT